MGYDGSNLLKQLISFDSSRNAKIFSVTTTLISTLERLMEKRLVVKKLWIEKTRFFLSVTPLIVRKRQTFVLVLKFPLTRNHNSPYPMNWLPDSRPQCKVFLFWWATRFWIYRFCSLRQIFHSQSIGKCSSYRQFFFFIFNFFFNNRLDSFERGRNCKKNHWLMSVGFKQLSFSFLYQKVLWNENVRRFCNVDWTRNSISCFSEASKLITFFKISKRFLQNDWVDYIFQEFNIRILLCCGYFLSKLFILIFVVECSWTKKPESAVLMTCLDVRAFKASTIQAAFSHQGLNRFFFVKGRRYLPKVHGSCPLHRICSTDWRKGAQFLMFLRGIGIPARPPQNTR